MSFTIGFYYENFFVLSFSCYFSWRLYYLRCFIIMYYSCFFFLLFIFVFFSYLIFTVRHQPKSIITWNTSEISKRSMFFHSLSHPSPPSSPPSLSCLPLCHKHALNFLFNYLVFSFVFFCWFFLFFVFVFLYLCFV